MNNAAPLRAARDGGTVDYERLYDQHGGFIWRYCYRLAGSAADADDLVQETFVRAMERPPADPETDLRPWLVRVATNLSRDAWRREQRRRYVGPWLPSPVETADGSSWCESLAPDAETRYEQLESVTFAFLLALEALTPSQRAVLLLRDVYGYSSAEAASALEMSVANVRTTLHRARRAMAAYDRNRSRPSAELEARNREALERFVATFAKGDVATMEAQLAEDVRCLSDGGGQFYAARRPIVGRQRVALFHSRIAPPPDEPLHSAYHELNGLPALVCERPEAAPGFARRWVFRIELDASGLIATCHSVLATAKLTAVAFDLGGR